jgi:4-amino-4-deoxy-L-arabinose transferase-like glycosyltransferase
LNSERPATQKRGSLSQYAETEFLWVLVALFALLNVNWIWRFRYGKPLNVDEAGYLGFSLSDYHALKSVGGLIAWWNAADSPSIYAPFMMAFSSLSYVVLGANEFAGFLTQVFFGVVAVVASFFIGKRLGGTVLGFLSAVLVATCPALINAARSYSFPAASAAVTTLAVLALLQSDGFTRKRWSVFFGILLGLMPLSRVMCIAFVPGVMLAAASQVVMGGQRTKRSAILGLSFVLSALVSATWLARSAPFVWSYLVSYGYGKESLSAGPQEHLFSIGAWRDTLYNLWGHVHLPHLVVLLSGVAALAALLVRSISKRGWSSAVVDAFKSGILPLLFVIGEGLAALTSTGNKGSGFVVTLVPLMLIAAAWCIFTLARGSTAIAGAVMAAAILSCLPMVDLSWPIARPWSVSVPFIGPVYVTDGRADIQIWEGGAMDQATAKAWRAANVRASQEMVAHAPQGVRAGIGFENPLLNVNTIQLERLLQTEGEKIHSLSSLERNAAGDSVAGYARWLNGPKPMCLLFTESEAREQMGLPISPRLMEQAAARSGFVPVVSWRLPDGAMLTLRRRPSACGP